jgi:hypothetical protein
MLNKPNSFNDLRRAVQFLSEHASDHRQEPQYLPRYVDARLDEGQIVCTSDTSSPRSQRRSKSSFQRVPSDLYLRFAALSEGTDENILAFAGQWGPLKDISGPSEPISSWHFFSHLAAALLRAAVGLVGGPPCQQSHWTNISEWAYENAILLGPDVDKELLMYGIAASLNKWHNDPGIPQGLVKVVGGRIQIDPASVGLFSAIVTQLACVISNTHRMAVCDACGRGFSPKRRPSQGMRQYCPRRKCKQAAQRQAALEYRQRKKAAS